MTPVDELKNSSMKRIKINRRIYFSDTIYLAYINNSNRFYKIRICSLWSVIETKKLPDLNAIGSKVS